MSVNLKSSIEAPCESVRELCPFEAEDIRDGRDMMLNALQVLKMGGDIMDIKNSLAELSSSTGELTDLFRRRLLDDRAKSKLIADLMAQLNAQRLMPLCREFILLLDRMESVDDDFVASVCEEIFEILSHYGLELVDGPRMFDPSKQRIIAMQDDADAAEGEVLRVARSGFALGGVVLRPQDVVICSHASGSL